MTTLEIEEAEVVSHREVEAVSLQEDEAAVSLQEAEVEVEV